MTFTVTGAHAEAWRGRRKNLESWAPSDCAVALAIKDANPGIEYVSVNVLYTMVGNEQYRIHDELRDFISQLDQYAASEFGKPSLPRTFTMERVS